MARLVLAPQRRLNSPPVSCITWSLQRAPAPSSRCRDFCWASRSATLRA